MSDEMLCVSALLKIARAAERGTGAHLTRKGRLGCATPDLPGDAVEQKFRAENSDGS